MTIADVMGEARERFNDWLPENVPPILKEYRDDYNFSNSFFDSQADQLREDIENDINLHETWFDDLRGRLQLVEADEDDGIVESWFEDLTDTVTNAIVESWSVTQSRSLVHAYYRELIDKNKPELSKSARIEAEKRLSETELDNLINYLSTANPLTALGVTKGTLIDPQSSNVLNLVTPRVANKVEAVAPDFYKANHINNDQLKQPEVVNTVIKLCAQSIVIDLSHDYASGLDENSLDTDITEYIAENLSVMFIRAKFQQSFNFELARDVATNLLLDNIRAYSDYIEAHDPSWWLDKIHRVPDNMSVIRNWDNAEHFVTEYVPDWENEE